MVAEESGNRGWKDRAGGRIEDTHFKNVGRGNLGWKFPVALFPREANVFSSKRIRSVGGKMVWNAQESLNLCKGVWCKGEEEASWNLFLQNRIKESKKKNACLYLQLLWLRVESRSRVCFLCRCPRLQLLPSVQRSCGLGAISPSSFFASLLHTKSPSPDTCLPFYTIACCPHLEGPGLTSLGTSCYPSPFLL